MKRIILIVIVAVCLFSCSDKPALDDRPYLDVVKLKKASLNIDTTQSYYVYIDERKNTYVFNTKDKRVPVYYSGPDMGFDIVFGSMFIAFLIGILVGAKINE